MPSSNYTLCPKNKPQLSQLLLDNCEQMRLSSSLHATQNQVGGGTGLNKVITRIFINFFSIKNARVLYYPFSLWMSTDALFEIMSLSFSSLISQ